MSCKIPSTRTLTRTVGRLAQVDYLGLALLALLGDALAGDHVIQASHA
jgi:hypothetical protein